MIAAEAVRYAAAGIPVIPLHGIDRLGDCTCPRGVDCTSPGKHPRWPGWQTMTADPVATAGAFSNIEAAGGAANIGLRLCAVGLAVLDIDSMDGAAALEDLVDDQFLRTAPCAKTGRGVHYYVRTDRRPGTIAPGLELKSENVVAPPSLVAGGKPRAWMAGRALGDLGDVPALPMEVAELLVTRRAITDDGTRDHGATGSPRVSIIPPLEWFAAALLDRGVPEELVARHILGAR
jgi:hypothetical protein